MRRCLESVRAWTGQRNWDYRLLGDEMLDLPPAWVRTKAAGRTAMIADVARLMAARDFLTQGYERAVWLDADVLVFDPESLRLEIDADYAFGREIWVQEEGSGRLSVRRHVHNAACLFARGNPVLDFLIHASLSVVERIDGHVPAQIVGPKMLTALHSIVDFPLIQEVGMLSPPVLRDIANQGGPALGLLRASLEGPMAAANLCASLADGVGERTIETACDRLLDTALFPPRFTGSIT